METLQRIAEHPYSLAFLFFGIIALKGLLAWRINNAHANEVLKDFEKMLQEERAREEEA